MANNYLVHKWSSRFMYKSGDPMLSITYSDQECHTGVEKKHLSMNITNTVTQICLVIFIFPKSTHTARERRSWLYLFAIIGHGQMRAETPY